MDESKYAQLKADGADAVCVYTTAIADGVDRISAIRIIRELFALDLLAAKEIVVAAEEGKTLAQHQKELALEVEKWVAEDEKDKNGSPRS